MTTSLADLHHAAVDDHGDGIVTVSIRHAGKLNVLGSQATIDLRAAIVALSERTDVRAIVLRGTGERAFVAGSDIHEMAALVPDTARRFIEALRALCESVRQCPVPVIARLPGWTLGGGLELAAACDIRIASNRAQFGMPEVKVGIPSVIHAALLPRLVGQARANWLILTGENIDAAQALSWGLVDTVVPHDRLDDEVMRLARQFAGFGPAVLRQQKRLLREWQQQDLDTSIRKSVDEFAAAFETGEPATYMAPHLARSR